MGHGSSQFEGGCLQSYDFWEAENSICVEDDAAIRAAAISDFDKITTVSTSLQVWHGRSAVFQQKCVSFAPIIAMIR